VAGADPQARTGQSTAGATHLIKVAVEAALGKRESVSVFGTDFDTPDGTGVRDYIHVSDLAAAHVLALEALTEAPGQSLTMNCGYGTGFSVLDVLDAVDRATNIKISRVLEGRRAGDPIADLRQQPHQGHPAMGAALCRSGSYCRACPGVGAPFGRDS
jgi:UDP-glucose 4-epimerase